MRWGVGGPEVGPLVEEARLPGWTAVIPPHRKGKPILVCAEGPDPTASSSDPGSAGVVVTVVGSRAGSDEDVSGRNLNCNPAWI